MTDGLPATVAGLYQSPCEALILAVRLDGAPLHGLTGRVDWRMGGQLSALVARGVVPEHTPLLIPAPEVLPTPRLVLWRTGAVTPLEMARHLRALARPCGLCPEDFYFARREVSRAFGGEVVLYGDEP